MAIPKVLLLPILGCAFFCSAALAARDLSDESAMVARHEQWMAQYSRVYKDAAEKARRFEVFKANVNSTPLGTASSGSASTSSLTSPTTSSGPPRLTRASDLAR
jgi:hypothetical protein